MKTWWLAILLPFLINIGCKKHIYTARLESAANAWLETPTPPFRYASLLGDTLMVTTIEESTGAFDIGVPQGADALANFPVKAKDYLRLLQQNWYWSAYQRKTTDILKSLNGSLRKLV